MRANIASHDCCRVMSSAARGFCWGHFTIAVPEQAGSNAAIPVQLATFANQRNSKNA
jgi:hypothetical protein